MHTLLSCVTGFVPYPKDGQGYNVIEFAWEDTTQLEGEVGD